MAINSSTTPGTTGADSITGTASADTYTGGGGADTIRGGDGADVIYGDAPTAGQWNYAVYNRDFTSANGQAPQITQGTFIGRGYVNDFGVGNLGNISRGNALTTDPNDFGVTLTSTLRITSTGSYRFTTTSDDGSRIIIRDANGNVVNWSANDAGTGTPGFMNNDFHQGATTRGGSITLTAGQTYTIEVQYWENEGANILSGTVTPPGGTAQDLATSPLIGVPPTTGHTDGNDSLFGGAGNDTIYGNGGNDTISGDEGNDLIFAGDGDDQVLLSGAYGNDTISGGAGTDQLRGNALTVNTTVTFTNGAGTYNSTGGNAQFTEFEVITTGSGNDSINAENNTQNGVVFQTNDGNDTVIGGTGAENVDLGGGNDTFVIRNGHGADTIAGGAGRDVLNGGQMTNQVNVVFTNGNGTFTSGSGQSAGFTGFEEITTGTGADLIDATNNTVNGATFNTGDGNDEVRGALLHKSREGFIS